MTELGEDFLGVAAFAEDVVDLFEVFQVTMGESFLIRDEEVGVGGAKPSWKDPFEEDVGIAPRLAGKKATQSRDAAAVADGDIVSGSGECAVDEVDVAVESHTVGAGDDVDTLFDR
tara:strand:+ start:261 stop:608 length:348 start_codon:yes stop_codon:yes gene_type:complete